MLLPHVLALCTAFLATSGIAMPIDEKNIPLGLVKRDVPCDIRNDCGEVAQVSITNSGLSKTDTVQKSDGKLVLILCTCDCYLNGPMNEPTLSVQKVCLEIHNA
jgi:hypothetical protein